MPLSSTSYQNELYKIEFKEGILFVTYISGPITLDVAKNLVLQRTKLTNNQPCPVLVNSVHVNEIDLNARSFLASEEGVKGLTAGAIVTNSIFTKHLANFFMNISFSKSKMPARVFSDEKDAIEWLNQFKS